MSDFTGCYAGTILWKLRGSGRRAVPALTENCGILSFFGRRWNVLRPKLSLALLHWGLLWTPPTYSLLMKLMGIPKVHTSQYHTKGLLAQRATKWWGQEPLLSLTSTKQVEFTELLPLDTCWSAVRWSSFARRCFRRCIKLYGKRLIYTMHVQARFSCLNLSMLSFWSHCGSCFPFRNISRAFFIDLYHFCGVISKSEILLIPNEASVDWFLLRISEKRTQSGPMYWAPAL